MASKQLHIGSAGWSLSRASAPFFPGDGTHLERYARRFNMAEINSSFYRPHQASTYGKWAASVPSGFRFAVKFPRAATHDARLRGCVPVIDTFLSQVSGLGDRLGPILVQLPPSLQFEARTANAFFRALRARFDGAIVCEPRHASWFEKKTDAFWSRFEVSRVAADPVRDAEAAKPGGAGRVRYWRLHGSPRIYYDAYGEEGLQPWARDIRAARRKGHDCWVVFDNTAHSHAIPDALRLQAMLTRARKPA
ncbi:DUF72 domain-containing protein [Lysobacter sp. TY2-98]|uniref:DUF72 domain-containing protein n=1 Tax=Lysobacter sp. TY2-98 TaxID=2290922 RepID=UPI000E20B739|nr:DUF72 domain-containing protein [Lysobacter sp. TY2-98]AXK73605.1 DUF72 domain-containing protein [Lysobacter sp. TY2-98]